MNWNHCAHEFSDALSSPAPTPGGGAAAAMAGAMGCALLMMALGTTLKRKNTPADAHPILKNTLQPLNAFHEKLKNLITQDAQAYEAYLTAAKLPKDDAARPRAVQESLWQAACVPVQTAQICLQVKKELDSVRPFISTIILSDANCARHLLNGAISCCVENIRANAAYLTDTARQAQLQTWMDTFSKEACL